jgi:integrase
MANRAVKIYDHVKREDGSWTMLPVEVNINKPLSAARQIQKGQFKITWYEGTKKKASLGHITDLTSAVKAAKFKLLQLQGLVNGVEVENPEEKNARRMPIDVAADAYLRNTKLKARPGTYALAEHDLREWQEWNEKKGPRHNYVDQITENDMLEYRLWCQDTGRAPRTAVNKTLRINHFVCKTLKLEAGQGPIKQVEAEKIITNSAKNDVEYYSEAELAKFFAECNFRQRLIFSTFRESGCRREELEFLYWDDLNFETGELYVRKKPEFNFVVKNKQERQVPLPMDLVARLKEQKKHSKSRLVFATKNGTPLGNSILVACKRIAKRAGLNCGICETCIEKKECEHWFLHKFRATCATMYLQDGMDVATLQEILGHETLEATMRYLGNLKNAALRVKVDAIRQKRELLTLSS